MSSSFPPLPDRSELMRFFRSQIARRLQCDPAEIDSHRDLHQMGLQSIDAVVITGELEDYIDREVDPTLLLNHRTIAQIVDACFEHPTE